MVGESEAQSRSRVSHASGFPVKVARTQREAYTGLRKVGLLSNGSQLCLLLSSVCAGMFYRDGDGDGGMLIPCRGSTVTH